ncbi:protein shisa-2 homolog isoform X2 [Hemicordylus capensis]|uniref:protein shisa-2 homolog isoform X2 n=1 Tax=Hemicordylus capensis TaxID=884348 RepID=UPI0023033C64|nr:protein shisa-2 homolog isoform X2 [Hemicordylus capensis]
MGRALSCAALALLLAQSVGCSQVGLWRHFFGGGYCWVWARHPALIGRTFRCPRREDRREDRFCCGTCFFPSCCSSRRKRLDQPWCPRRLGNGTFSRLPFSDPGRFLRAPTTSPRTVYKGFGGAPGCVVALDFDPGVQGCDDGHLL